MAKEKHTALMVAGAGGAAFAAYEFLYKPWKTKQALDALAAATPGQAYASPGAGGGGAFTPFVSTPTIVGQTGQTGGPYQGSIVDPRNSPGGDVGQAMWRKNWTQAQAAARLAAIKKGYSDSLGAITQLQQQVANPAAAGIASAQLAAQQNDQAAANAIAQQQAAVAKGDTAGAALWASAAASHQQDAREIRARIATASAPPDNSAAIATYQGVAAALKADYKALTGLELG